MRWAGPLGLWGPWSTVILRHAGYDVTCEQWSVLVNLGKKNGQSQQELAGLICKDKTSVTRLIDNMEKHSLVVRIPVRMIGAKSLFI